MGTKFNKFKSGNPKFQFIKTFFIPVIGGIILGWPIALGIISLINIFL